jgi:hypothetical protein
VQWIDERGFPHSFKCGPGAPCNLVVRVQVTGDTVFANVPICFGFGCPAEPQPPTAAPVAASPEATTTTTVVPGESKKGKAGKAGESAAGTESTAPESAGTGEETEVAASRANEPISVSRDSSRGTRVLVAGCVGALGGARLVQISNRARRRKSAGSVV